MSECEAHRLIGRKHQCPNCCALLLPGEHHKGKAECDAFWRSVFEPIEPLYGRAYPADGAV